MVDGVEVIKISKHDSGFMRFVMEGFASSGTLTNMVWLDQLKQLRMKASLDLNMDKQDKNNLASLFGSVAISKTQAKKQRTQCQARLDLGDLPKFVEIDLPEFEHQGEYVPACRVRVVTALDLKALVQVELKADTLDYIKKAMQASSTEPEDTTGDCGSSSSRSAGVYWRPERNAFVCKRKVDGSWKYQTFKVENEDRERALSLANRWVNDP